jgi:hypothetical protein
MPQTELGAASRRQPDLIGYRRLRVVRVAYPSRRILLGGTNGEHGDDFEKIRHAIRRSRPIDAMFPSLRFPGFSYASMFFHLQ